MNKFEIVTDTSTIALFDVGALAHRIDSDGDWWTYNEFPELKEEVRHFNIILIDTGCDGVFEVAVEDCDKSLELKLNCPSGKLYIVCGEEIPGGGLTPELLRGGAIYDVRPGLVSISYTKNGRCINVRVHS